MDHTWSSQDLFIIVKRSLLVSRARKMILLLLGDILALDCPLWNSWTCFAPGTGASISANFWGFSSTPAWRSGTNWRKKSEWPTWYCLLSSTFWSRCHMAKTAPKAEVCKHRACCLFNIWQDCWLLHLNLWIEKCQHRRQYYYCLCHLKLKAKNNRHIYNPIYTNIPNLQLGLFQKKI